MEENNMNVLLMNKLGELNELEITKAKVLTAIFTKTSEEIVNKKVKSLESNFETQAEYYDQKKSDYQDICDEIISKYQKQLNQIVDKYNELFINIQLELQEAECNQKIAITNLKKSFDIKNEILDKAKKEMLDEYTRKITACMKKKSNYDIIIEECEKELNKCSVSVENQINNLFSDKSSQISLKEESGFRKILSKIKNIFNGKNKFNDYVIEPMNVEIEMMENKLPDIVNNLHQETIEFVAKMKQAKDETNKMFEEMIKQG